MIEYHFGGLIVGSTEVELFEGERIIDRNGNVIGEVINGEFVQIAPPTAQPRKAHDSSLSES